MGLEYTWELSRGKLQDRNIHGNWVTSCGIGYMWILGRGKLSAGIFLGTRKELAVVQEYTWELGR